MSRLGQQMFFARKRSANVAAAEGCFFARKRSANVAAAAGCFLRESVVLTLRQQRVLFVRKRSDSNSTDVGHEGVTQPSLQSTYILGVRLNKCHPQLDQPDKAKKTTLKMSIT
ncbi:hypothetical protein [Lysinibacillus xylanilyticus]|uniref:hypothetical protein n=1 Tax=Lysinibacillus xylanilyticus TaxID=582475 RepID=UPI00083CA254|nr:hypothetical protein [Lysinibacillus xylanilyticus]